MNDLDITHFLGRLLLVPLLNAPATQLKELSRNPLEWEKIIRVASENLITPALYTSFCSLNVFRELPRDLQGYLMEIHHCNAERNKKIKEQVLQIASSLNKNGVEPLFLKGVANLFYDIYPDPADRILRDADILVPKNKLLECVHILKEEGYYFAYDKSLFDGKSRHYPCLISDREEAIVELHQYSVPTQYTPLYSEEEFWASSMARTIKDARFRLPPPMDHIMIHIIHAHVHHGVCGTGHFFLRGLYDFALLCRKFEDHISWSLLETSFTHWGIRKAFVSYILAADTFCGYQDPLRHVEIKNTERLFLQRVNIFLKYPALFAFWKLFSYYKQASSAIATDKKRRKEFLKKLRNRQFYVRHAKIIVECLLGH
jgi:hypothetical protein